MFDVDRQRIGLGVLGRLNWVQRSLLLGFAITVVWTFSTVPRDLTPRMVHDLTLFVVVPGVLAITHGKHIGWRVDRLAVRNAILLGLIVLPFYLVGSTLPSIREYYPMWRTTLTLGEFLPHQAQQLLLVIAAETYYRGLLCVGVRDLGFKSVFISPIVYAFHHVGKPPIELVLSAPADVLFGIADYKSNSILPSVVAHGGGLLLLDWLVMHDPILPPGTVVEWLSWVPVPL